MPLVVFRGWKTKLITKKEDDVFRVMENFHVFSVWRLEMCVSRSDTVWLDPLICFHWRRNHNRLGPFVTLFLRLRPQYFPHLALPTCSICFFFLFHFFYRGDVSSHGSIPDISCMEEEFLCVTQPQVSTRSSRRCIINRGLLLCDAQESGIREEAARCASLSVACSDSGHRGAGGREEGRKRRRRRRKEWVMLVRALIKTTATAASGRMMTDDDDEGCDDGAKCWSPSRRPSKHWNELCGLLAFRRFSLFTSPSHRLLLEAKKKKAQHTSLNSNLKTKFANKQDLKWPTFVFLAKLVFHLASGIF